MMSRNVYQSSLPVSSTPSVVEMFRRFADCTDGKQSAGRILREIVANGGHDLLVDLGAGNGTLAAHLASHFASVLLIDRNEENRESLSQVANGRVVISEMQHAMPVPHFDVALLSYSLTGVPREELPHFLNELMACRKPGGRVLFVTFQDGCDWDRFVSPIYADIGRSRNGGVNAHVSLVESAGLKCQQLASFETELFDTSVELLAFTLGFSFAPNHDQYFKGLIGYTEALRAMTVPSKCGGVAIRCVEEIWEIKCGR